MTEANTDQARAGHKRRRFSKSEREAHLSGWGASGKSAPEYAQAHGLLARHLYVWRRQERLRAGLAKEAAEERFIAVRLEGPTHQREPLTLSLRSGALEFVLRGGASLEELISAAKLLKREVLDV